jgi:NADH-quinone oxidoreductase subunit F
VRSAQGVLRELGDSGSSVAARPSRPVEVGAVASQPSRPKYVVANADESEPGTFKDTSSWADPFALVEATTIGGFAVGAERGIYMRGSTPMRAGVASAIDQAYRRATWAPM